MAVLIIWFYNMSDRVPPEMRFVAMDLVYDSNTVEADLLKGVMAYDSVDGDITNRIVVEKTILDEEEATAVVYYAVSDMSGNVSKQSRVFPADLADLKGEKAEEEQVNDGTYPQIAFGSGSETEGVTEYSEEGFENADGENESTSEEGSGENTEAGTAGN